MSFRQLVMNYKHKDIEITNKENTHLKKKKNDEKKENII